MDGTIEHESQYFEDPVSVTPFAAEPAASAEEAISGAGSSQPDEPQEASEHSSSPKRNSPASPVKEQESKRVKKLDESFSPAEESSSSEEGEISAASDSDEPIEDPKLFDGAAADDDDVQNLAYEDSEFFEACKKGLSALKGRLTKAMNADKFDYIYPFYKIDDDLADDFVSWCAENMIDWEKFEKDPESSKRSDDE